MSDWTCSKCPLLDLGAKLEAKDPRDPWRRSPRLFAEAQAVFGNGMFNHASPLRLRVERLLGHYCKVQREKHGPCNAKRMRVCARVTREAIAHGREGVDQGQRLAYAQAALKKAVNDQGVYDELKATRTAVATKGLKMPPITFREVPAG